MKKITNVLIFSILLLTSCEPYDSSNEILTIPQKTNITDNDVLSSPINSSNLDNYMFRDDVQYVDLRSVNMVLTEGYVSGFSFIPFYNIIASFTGTKTLYTMKGIDNVSPGQVGSFVANYEESNTEIEYYFTKEKYIFFISQGGSEGSYMINLLIQLGYDASKLYNVGGVSNSEGRPAYKNVESNKYFVSSGVNGITFKIDYEYNENLTPIDRKEN